MSSRWESNPRGAGTVSTAYKAEPLREVASRVLARYPEHLVPAGPALEALAPVLRIASDLPSVPGRVGTQSGHLAQVGIAWARYTDHDRLLAWCGWMVLTGGIEPPSSGL